MKKIIGNRLESRLHINTAPGNYQFIGMILQALPMAKVIYCSRDPVDNCMFVYFVRYTHANEHAYVLKDIATYHAGYQDLMAHWQRLYGDRILGARYEDLVRNPAEIGARIYEFCGLDYAPGAVESTFTTDEIDHWQDYEAYLGPLRQALGRLLPG